MSAKFRRPAGGREVAASAFTHLSSMLGCSFPEVAQKAKRHSGADLEMTQGGDVESRQMPSRANECNREQVNAIDEQTPALWGGRSLLAPRGRVALEGGGSTRASPTTA